MATNILLKSSVVASKIPTTAQLSLRELAVNTVDGKLFLRQGTGIAGDNIYTVNPWNQSTGGASYNLSFTAGNVGIGTTPSYKLDVFGSGSFRPASTQDGLIVSGRAGGTSSYSVTITPTTLNANRTLTVPDITGTIITSGDTGTVTNTMLSGSIAPGKVSLNSANIIVGNGSNVGAAVSLSGDATISNTGTLTIASSAITYAKIQNVSATDRLLGRSTAGAGVVEEIICTAAGRALLDDADAATQRTTLGALAASGGTATNLTLSGTLTAGGGNGTNGQVLTSTGTGVQWSNAFNGITISDDTSTNATRYLTFTSATTGTINSENVSSTKLTFNPSTGNLGVNSSSASFRVDVSGDVRVQSTNRMRFGGTAGTTNFYIQYNSTANSLDFIAG